MLGVPLSCTSVTKTMLTHDWEAKNANVIEFRKRNRKGRTIKQPRLATSAIIITFTKVALAFNKSQYILHPEADEGRASLNAQRRRNR